MSTTLERDQDLADARKWRMFSAVHDTLGIYPAGWAGKYEKRTEYMNGWNDAVRDIFRAYVTINQVYDKLAPGTAQQIEDLLKLDVAFWTLEASELGEKGQIPRAKLVVNLSDTFAYASADAEDLPFEEVHRVHKIFLRHGYDGVVAWAALRRKQAPIVPRQTPAYRAAWMEL